MNLGTFKGKKVAAQKGYDLLKSKADALKVSTVLLQSSR
jgi:vacuolar-type H+-ATPase subunit D/Vma8